MELHPSPTSRTGNIFTDAVTMGRHKDTGPFRASDEVWCVQCGFRCNLGRDAKGIYQFAGDTTTSGNELANGSFENWTAGSPDSWTVSGSVTQTTEDGFFDWRDGGVSGVKIVRSGSTISLSQTLSTPSDFNDDVLNFGARIKSTTNRMIRLKVELNSDTHFSSYSVGQQRFQDLSLCITTPASVSSLTVSVQADNEDGTVYVDSAVLSRYGNPTTVSVDSGCPHCGSFNYFTRLNTLDKKVKPSN